MPDRIAPHTVRDHISNIATEVDVTSRGGLDAELFTERPAPAVGPQTVSVTVP
ncbi:hypothetical protein [Streptomyces sp. NPDC048295]|uniref:hypothetical protein n=1 Tax=Streptomyces sp. NPDC048295 TaxID=3154617 RepID=UPI003419D769